MTWKDEIKDGLNLYDDPLVVCKPKLVEYFCFIRKLVVTWDWMLLIQGPSPKIVKINKFYFWSLYVANLIGNS